MFSQEGKIFKITQYMHYDISCTYMHVVLSVDLRSSCSMGLWSNKSKIIKCKATCMPIE